MDISKIAAYLILFARRHPRDLFQCYRDYSAPDYGNRNPLPVLRRLVDQGYLEPFSCHLEHWYSLTDAGVALNEQVNRNIKDARWVEGRLEFEWVDQPEWTL